MTNTSYLIGVIIDGLFYSDKINKLSKSSPLYQDSMIVGQSRRWLDFNDYEGKAIAIRVDNRDNHAMSITELGNEIKEELVQLDKDSN